MDQPRRDTADQRCPRCAAVGAHYLTCPTLQLPAGYRLSKYLGTEDDPAASS